MSDTTYNGWSNYETWVVNLWIDNEESSQKRWVERAAELVQGAIDDEPAEDPKTIALDTLADELEAEHDDATPELSGVFSDLLTHALGRVDWREIAESMLSGVDVYSAGWNMPGYMPDNAPALFTDESSARAHISDAMGAAIPELEYVEHDPRVSELETASAAVLKGSGEYGATVAGVHYFITKV